MGIQFLIEIKCQKLFIQMEAFHIKYTQYLEYLVFVFIWLHTKRSFSIQKLIIKLMKLCFQQHRKLNLG